jgi:transcription elongation factor GreB
MDSPVARALMKKTIDDEITVKTPKGELNYVIIEVSYQSSD